MKNIKKKKEEKVSDMHIVDKLHVPPQVKFALIFLFFAKGLAKWVR